MIAAATAVDVPQHAPASPARIATRRRFLWILGLSVAVLLMSAIASLLVGSRELPVSTVWEAVLGQGDPEADALVRGQRLPRTLLGALAGAALAVAGALIQGHTRNPLADPGLLGVTAGSSLFVVLAISVLGLTTPATYLWFAFAGAGLGTALTMVIGLMAGRRRDASPASLVLAGAAVSSFLGAGTGIVLLVDASTLDIYRFWSVGSLASGRGMEVITPVAPVLLLGLALAIAHAPALNALALGDDVARSLGRRLLPTRLLGLLCVTVLVGTATSLVGSLGFVGLIAPHLVRRLSGTDFRVLVPLSALTGASLVLLADVLGRIVVSPSELPVGIVLGVIGGPALLVVVLRFLRTA